MEFFPVLYCTTVFLKMTVCIPMILNKISLHSKCDFDTQENCMNFKSNIFILLQVDFIFDAEELQELKLKLSLS